MNINFIYSNITAKFLVTSNDSRSGFCDICK